MAKLYDMDKLFSANLEDNEVYNVTLIETETLCDNPPAGIPDCKNADIVK